MTIRTRAIVVLRLALALMPVGATLTLAVPVAASPPRQPGPCDISGAAGFDAGQTIMIDTGVNLETAVIAMAGTAGATTAGTAVDVGAAVIALPTPQDLARARP